MVGVHWRMGAGKALPKSWIDHRKDGSRSVAGGRGTTEGSMKSLLDSARKLFDRLCERDGEMSLFALFRPGREDEQWELVIAASWLKNDRAAYDVVFNEMRATFAKND